MKKYNVKLMDNKKGYLNAFNGQLEERFLFLSFKEERNGFKTEFTEEKIEFKSLPMVASYFGIGESTLRRWVLYGMSVMELASEQDRPRLEATQSKLKGFEIYKATEWSEFNGM